MVYRREGMDEWNMTMDYYRRVSVHRHGFAAPVRSGSASFLDKNGFLHVCILSKCLYLLYVLPLL